MTDVAEPKRTLWESIKHEAMDWLSTLAWAVPIFLGFTTVAFASYNIPSESMVPTLQVGDRIIVSKFSYGYSRDSLPFDLGHMLMPDKNERIFGKMPQRGDVVVFRHPAKNEVLVKRLIGLPGDVIEVREGHLIVNNEPVALKDLQMVTRFAFQAGPERALERQEVLPGGVTHIIDEFSDQGPADNFGPFKVPDGDVFMMGDNRDNSADSRFPSLGPIPIQNLIGRAEMVMFTLNFCNPNKGYDCGPSRVFKPLAKKAS